MDLQHKEVSLSDIDLTDAYFHLDTVTLADGALLQSIAEMGILQPVLLREKNGRFQILSGFKRIYVATAVNLSHIWASIFPPSASDLDCLKAIVVTQKAPLSTLHISRILQLLQQKANSDAEFYQWVEEVLQLRNCQLIRDYLFVQELSPNLHRYVEEGTLSLPILSLFVQKLDREAQPLVAKLFSDYKFSFQKQREIIMNLYEISRLEIVSISSLLQAPEFLAINSNDALDKGHTASQIRDYFRKKRYPTLTQTEIAFKEAVKEFHLPSTATITPPEGFEGNTFRIQFSFSNREELNETIKGLTDMAKNPSLATLLQKF